MLEATRFGFLFEFLEPLRQAMKAERVQLFGYAPGKLTRQQIEGVHFQYADLNETLKRYDPAKMKEGWNTMPDGEKVYFISTPSAGLWSTKSRMKDV